MTAPPTTTDPAPAPAGTPQEVVPGADAAPLRLSGTVQASVAQFGEDPIVASALVDAILGRHPEYLRHWPTASVAWPDGQAEQPAGRWIAELRPLVPSGQFVFGRLAVTCLCLLDARMARTAERSGMLFALARDITPDVAEFVSTAGLRLLRGRAPIAALGLGLLETAVEQAATAAESVVQHISLARQPQGVGIGRWAAASSRGFYVGHGSVSARVLEGSPVTALGWSRRHRVLAVLAPSDGPGLMTYDPASEQLDSVDEWPPAQAAAISEDSVAVEADGHVLWGPSDDSTPLRLEGLTGLISQMTTAGERVAVVADDRLQVRLVGGWWLDVGGAAPRTRLASTDRTLVVAAADGEVRGLAWSEDVRRQKTPVIRQTFALTPFPRDPSSLSGARPHEQSSRDGDPVDHLASAGDVTVVASGHRVAVLSGDDVVARWETSGRVTALALSPDGVALALATEDVGVRIWRVDGQRDLRLTSYSTDSTEGEDLLGIGPTVDALAALIAATAMTPPLSVGLFGAWGSGKSFFMQRLFDRVAQVADESRDSGRTQRSLWAWRNIRQVRFNAWNYASADVWAGLLEQLIRELSSTRSEGLPLSRELAELQRRRVERLAGARAGEAVANDAVQRAERQLQEAQAAVAQANDCERQLALKAAQARDRAGREQVSQDVRDTATKAIQDAGLEPLAESTQALMTQLAATRRSVGSLHALFGGDRRWWLLAALLVGPALAVLAAVIVNAVQPSLTVAATTITWLAGSMTAVAAWLGHANAWVESRLKAIDTAEAAAVQEWEVAQQGVRDAELAAAEAAAAAKKAEADATQAAREVASASARAATVGAGDLLVEYLEGRQTSDDYRSRLGLIGTVRADLEVISKAVEEHNKGMPDDDVVNRVVLYVDDLDRCPPAVVVRVLEAVHLLLSYPLFVVVVAVDAHWVSKSLATVYPTLLTGGEVSPDNYLEKIFQLPVWLDPPPPEAATAMALALLTPRSGVTKHVTDSRVPGDEDAAEDGTAPVIPTSRSGRQAGANLAGEVDLAASPPASVVIEDDERSAIGRLAPLLARSPRALKRYLNTYRLLKAVLPTEDLARARLLLAVATARPDLGERLLEQVADAAPRDTVSTVVEGWSPAERAWLTDNIPAGVAWRDITCRELAPAAAHVRRFVFRASVVVAAGTDDPPPTADPQTTSPGRSSVEPPPLSVESTRGDKR